MIDDEDDNMFDETLNEPPKFLPGDRVFVGPNSCEATVVEQMKSYDYPHVFWGNVRLKYDDGVFGTSNSWQLKKI